MKRFNEIRSEFAQPLENLLNEYLEKSGVTGSALCGAMSRYHLSTGGKRLRGIIPSAVFSALEKNPRDILGFGAAVEMIHNATLVHDDLQDGDELRRAKPTVWKKYSEAQAINCGDAMFQYANQMVANLPIEPHLIVKLLNRTSLATLRVIEGQAQEFAMKEENKPKTARYIEVIRGKTSGLFSLPIAGALEAASCDTKVVSTFEQAAMDMGMLFQIQDDLLDIYGQKGRDRVGTDIAEGKISILVARVFESGSPSQCAELESILKRPRQQTSDSEIARAIEIFGELRAKEFAIDCIRRIQIEIRNKVALESLPKVRDVMIELCDTFLEPVQGIM